MARRRARFLASVRIDLLAILTHVTEASGSVSVGARFVRRLRDRCHYVAALDAKVGRPRPELRPDIRSSPYLSHVIVFRYLDSRFEVVAIIEQHRDVAALFDEHETTDTNPRH